MFEKGAEHIREQQSFQPMVLEKLYIYIHHTQNRLASVLKRKIPSWNCLRQHKDELALIFTAISWI